MQVEMIHGVLHIRMRGRSGRSIWVPAPHLTPRDNALVLRCMGMRRVPMRGYCARVPQPQACKLPRSDHNLPLGWDDTCVREAMMGL